MSNLENGKERGSEGQNPTRFSESTRCRQSDAVYLIAIGSVYREKMSSKEGWPKTPKKIW
jgi:hypothetical protein